MFKLNMHNRTCLCVIGIRKTCNKLVFFFNEKAFFLTRKNRIHLQLNCSKLQQGRKPCTVKTHSISGTKPPLRKPSGQTTHSALKARRYVITDRWIRCMMGWTCVMKRHKQAWGVVPILSGREQHKLQPHTLISATDCFLI